MFKIGLNTEAVIVEWGQSYSKLLEDLLVSAGLTGALLEFARMGLIILSLILICWLADIAARKVIITIIEKIIKRTKNSWDDVLVEKNVFGQVAHLVPAVIIGVLSPIFFKGHPFWIGLASKVSSVYLVVGVVLTFIAFFRALQLYLESRPYLKDKPLDSYMQLVRLIAYIIGGIYVVAILVGKSPWGIFSALGAMSVVLMLVFRDTILGFVGSIQLAANNMVKIGDWVEFPKYGADGNVVEIKLQTIKVQNWDKTITTIPTYAFVSEAFKNWRGMEESGGRRIKKSLNIDMTSIKFCDDEMLKKLGKIHYISEYLDAKSKEIKDYNEQNAVDLSNFVNGRRITNVGTFKAYVEAYLKNHPQISKEMTFLVRHLQVSEKGLPIEIYVFSTEQRWVQFEDIAADIFDHLLAILPEFELRVFQNPTGADFNKIVK